MSNSTADSTSDSGGFVISDQANYNNLMVSTIMPFISVAPCVVILIVSGLVYCVPQAREKLDRISFRLMLWTMLLEVGYNITYTLEAPTLYPDATPVGCAIMVYFQLACQSGTNYLCACIAINLALYVSYHVDTVGKKFERWYVIGSLFLAFFIPLPPVILGQFGADPYYEGTCYFTSDDPNVRERQFVYDIYLWQALATVAATIAVGIVMVTLIRQGRETTRILFSNDSLNDDNVEQGQIPLHLGDVQLNYLQKKLFGILIRIAMYPIFLIVVSVICMVGDLYLSARDGPQDWADYGLFVVYNWFYASRSLPFAILGIFVDPSLIRGVKCAWRVKRGLDSGSHSSFAPMLNTDAFGALEDENDETGGGDMDFFTALAGTQAPVAPSATGMYTGHLSVAYPGEKVSPITGGAARSGEDGGERLNELQLDLGVHGVADLPDLSESGTQNEKEGFGSESMGNERENEKGREKEKEKEKEKEIESAASSRRTSEAPPSRRGTVFGRTWAQHRVGSMSTSTATGMEETASAEAGTRTGLEGIGTQPETDTGEGEVARALRRREEAQELRRALDKAVQHL